MTKQEWKKTFMNTLRPHVNDAPTVQELNKFLNLQADLCWETYDPYGMLNPQDGNPINAAITVAESFGYIE